MFQKIKRTLLPAKDGTREVHLYQNLIRHEAKIGGQVFGPAADDVRREFFCLDEHTWVWHEERLDDQGHTQVLTTRYDIRPNGILKSQNGQYQAITAREAQRLMAATQAYEKRVMREMYASVA